MDQNKSLTSKLVKNTVVMILSIGITLTVSYYAVIKIDNKIDNFNNWVRDECYIDFVSEMFPIQNNQTNTTTVYHINMNVCYNFTDKKTEEISKTCVGYRVKHKSSTRNESLEYFEDNYIIGQTVDCKVNPISTKIIYGQNYEEKLRHNETSEIVFTCIALAMFLVVMLCFMVNVLNNFSDIHTERNKIRKVISLQQKKLDPEVFLSEKNP